MNKNAIEINGLRKNYRGFSLGDVTFDVPQGYIMGLIGPNGAGKTTIIKAIMNLIRRHAGEIKVFGLDNLEHEPEVKSRIGFVYDTPCFPGDVKLENIRSALAPFYTGWDNRLFLGLANEFKLPLAKTFKKLSHGQKTRFALALALSHDADLILMDEPTAGLDPVFRLELLDRLQGIMQNEGKTILFSTHITTDLERIADYIAFVDKGKIVFTASMTDIQHRWGIVRSAEENFPTADIPGLRGFFRRAHSLEALSSDMAGAQKTFGNRAVYDKASLEDIMFFICKGENHV